MIKSPFQNPHGDMPKTVKGKSLMPEQAKRNLDSSVPMGESFTGEKPGPISSPYQDGSVKIMGRVKGPKNK